MDVTLATATIGAAATIAAATIGAIASRSKGRAIDTLRREIERYKTAGSHLEVDYGVRITSPSADDIVAEVLQVTGVYRVMPPPATLRLFVAKPGKLERYWPQEVVKSFDPDAKTWRAHVTIGGPTGDVKMILVAVVGSSTDVLWNYYHKVGPRVGWWDFEGWPPDSKICDKVRIVRA